jgi:hypothetical protein
MGNIRRQSDSDLWDAINVIKDTMSGMKESQARIETLLIGEQGSGVCGQVKEIKNDIVAIKKEMSEAPDKKRNFWLSLLASVGAVAAVIVSIFKRN